MSVHPIRTTQDERRREIDETFVPWHQDPYRLSKLWRWLVFRDLRPADPAYFMEHAEEYSEEYEAMQVWTGAP
jgi:hypothetical protein